MFRLWISCGHSQTLYILPTPLDNWGKKAIRRKTTGTGRMRYLKSVPRKYLPTSFSRLKNGFREGTQAKRLKQKGKGKAKPEVKDAK